MLCLRISLVPSSAEVREQAWRRCLVGQRLPATRNVLVSIGPEVGQAAFAVADHAVQLPQPVQCGGDVVLDAGRYLGEATMALLASSPTEQKAAPSELMTACCEPQSLARADETIRRT
jgi:hypothetical protein